MATAMFAETLDNLNIRRGSTPKFNNRAILRKSNKLQE
jgi:hypothetical protein